MMEMTIENPSDKDSTMKKLKISQVFRISIAAVAVMVVIQIFGNACSKSEKVTSSGGGPAPQTPVCNNKTGYFQPLSTCTASNVCTQLSKEFTDNGITQLTEPIVKPECRKAVGVDDDGEPYTTVGIDGTTRYACIHKPAGAGDRPLIIWFHAGGSGVAQDLYDETRLIEKSATFNWGTATNGFIVASVQGRSLHYPTDWPRDGYHHDFYFRSLTSPSANPDVAYTDHLIDHLVSQGGVDRSRIYVMGWSNGAMFGQMYAIARYATATPGGNKVAAAAVYSGGDPFHQINAGESPSCQLDPYPTSSVPIFIVRRFCDAALACNSVQQGWFDTPAGHETESWVAKAQFDLGIPMSILTLNGYSNVATGGCTSTLSQCGLAYGASTACAGLTADECGELMGFIMHMRWPAGLRENQLNGSPGIDHEPTMLNYLKSRPHPSP